MKEYSFDSREFLGEKENSPGIYADPSRGLVYSPFSLKVREWEKVLLLDVEGDDKYHVIELQSLNDQNGKGAAVILYRKDKIVDTYYSRNLKIPEDTFNFGSNWQIRGESDIEYTFEAKNSGVDAHFKMKDIFNQVIELRVKENSELIEFQNILAPFVFMEESQVFPLMYLKKFAPVQYEGTEIAIRVNGKGLKARVIPIKIHGKRRYFTRYSHDPLFAMWNRNFCGTLTAIDVKHIENNKCVFNGCEYDFVQNNGHYEISQMTGRSPHHKAFFKFSSAIPDILCLKDKSRIKGRFAAGVDDNSGVLGGEYTLQKDADKIKITVDLTTGWQPPIPGPLWFKSYKWIAEMGINKDEVAMESNWIKRKRIFSLW
jgi:hypothetical protein